MSLSTNAPGPSGVRDRRGSPIFLLMVLVAGLIVLSPLLRPGYFWGAHDARHDAYFIFQYDRAVQDGIWFARWAPDFTFGYGYPFFIVYGPLATFAGELFHHFLGFGYEESVKAVLALSILLSGLTMFGFVRSWLGRNAALVAAVAYMAIPYHLVDVFVRAALAESVALAFLPLVLWGFREAVLRPRPSVVVGAAFAYAAIMWSSNLVALVFTPALLLYVIATLLWHRKDQRLAGNAASLHELARAAVAPACAFLLGLGLSAAFFIPALVEQRYINQVQWFGEYYNPAQHFVYFHQLFDPTWGFGISQPGPDDVSFGAMSFQLGAAPALLSIVAVAIAGHGRPWRREVWFWAAWALVSVGLTLQISAPLWQRVPLVAYAQFPWRYLMLAILPLSVLPGALAAWFPGDSREQAPESLSWMSVLLAGLILVGSYPYLRVEMRAPTAEQGPVSFAALMRFQRTSDEMTGVTVWVDPARRPEWSAMAEQWVSGKPVTTWVDYSRVPQTKALAVNSEDVGSAHEQIYFFTDRQGQSITFNRFWYPGWRAYLLDGKDGRPVQEIEVVREDGPLARVVVPIPQGEGYLMLRFEETSLRRAASWTTWGAALVSALLLAWSYLTSRRQRTRRLDASPQEGGGHDPTS